MGSAEWVCKFTVVGGGNASRGDIRLTTRWWGNPQRKSLPGSMAKVLKWEPAGVVGESVKASVTGTEPGKRSGDEEKRGGVGNRSLSPYR